ncbi:hypothetical protein EJ02DRAFT_436385 [Clathrospora elynae]|uniref:Uncharacterized protein n=1 Tax=Clathrospora elynae TaxID=706981 RepID=A0A6A5SJ57_9PLEO|nr:hypothetical protein EJ02DRAFT_436385 [Clathrospora elynae]
MAQQGGTWSPGKDTSLTARRYDNTADVKIATSASSPQNSEDKAKQDVEPKQPTTTTTPPDAKEATNAEGQEWSVINKPSTEATDIDTHAGGVSSHFDFALGWGRWRTTIFSWDLSVRQEESRKKEGEGEKK